MGKKEEILVETNDPGPVHLYRISLPAATGTFWRVAPAEHADFDSSGVPPLSRRLCPPERRG